MKVTSVKKLHWHVPFIEKNESEDISAMRKKFKINPIFLSTSVMIL